MALAELRILPLRASRKPGEEARDNDCGSEEGTGEEIGWRQKGGYQVAYRNRARSCDCSSDRVSQDTELAFRCVGTRD
jgi:hypothetical protein